MIEELQHRPIEMKRYRTLQATLAPLRELIDGRNVLDFGAGYALSMLALAELGARPAGVEPDEAR